MVRREDVAVVTVWPQCFQSFVTGHRALHQWITVQRAQSSITSCWTQNGGRSQMALKLCGKIKPVLRSW